MRRVFFVGLIVLAGLLLLAGGVLAQDVTDEPVTAEPTAEVTAVAPDDLPDDAVLDDVPVGVLRGIFADFTASLRDWRDAIFSRDNVLAFALTLFTGVISAALYAVYRSLPPGPMKEMMREALDVARRHEQDALDRLKAGVGGITLPEAPLDIHGKPLGIAGVRVQYEDGTESFLMPDQLGKG